VVPSGPGSIKLINKRMRWAGHVARVRAIRNAYNVLVGKRAGKRPCGRSRRRWEDNIRPDLREMWWRVWTGCIWLKMGTSGGLL